MVHTRNEFNMLIYKEKSQMKVHQSAIAGAASGALTRALTQPLDVLKIRFQLQLEPIKKGSKYSSSLQAIQTIFREEGVRALWSGHVPAQLLSITYGILQFSTFETLTELCQQADQDFFNKHKHWINFCNGGIAACVATVASFPFDTVRTRLIAEQKTNKAYNGLVDAFHKMIKIEGPTAFFKGLIPTLGPIAPYVGVQFAIYKMLTENIFNQIKFFQRDIKPVQPKTTNLLANLVAGSIAGFTAKTATYPFDLVKKRLQIQGFQQYRTSFGKQMYCRGILDCVRLTIVEEGFRGLYKGYGPSMVKAISVSALHFAAYEEVKQFLIRRHL